MLFLLFAGIAIAGSELDRKVIDAQVRLRAPQISHCYKKELMAAKKPFAGKVISHFVIGPDGKVRGAHVTDVSLANEKVSSCVVKVLKKIVYPTAAGETEVDYPFTFKGADKASKEVE